MQQPGSFYVGNLAALQQPSTHEECKHTFDGAAATVKVDRTESASAASEKGDVGNAASAATAEGDARLQIAVMLRCDVFRNCRARKINSIPGPADFFRVVNHAAAQHLSDEPVALPDLTEVLLEMDRSDDLSDGLSDECQARSPEF